MVVEEPSTQVPATVACSERLKRYPQDVLWDIAPNDPMYLTAQGDQDRTYVGHARVMLDCIRAAMIAAKKPTAERILDLPSGHGRVLRLLRAEYPQAELTACDIKPDAVEFCAEKFSATPVYGKEDLKEVELPHRYDLIWCGSLLTHLDQDLWTEFLDFFDDALEVGGLLVVTFAGRHIAAAIEDKSTALGLSEAFEDDEVRLDYLRTYARDGFAYIEYPTPPEHRQANNEPSCYGLTLAKPSWVLRLLEQRKGLRVVSLSEGRWGAQDVLGLVRADVSFPPTLKYDLPVGAWR